MREWNDSCDDLTEWIRLICAAEVKIREKVVQDLLSKIRPVNIS